MVVGVEPFGGKSLEAFTSDSRNGMKASTLVMGLLQCAQYLSLSLAGQPQNLVGTQTSSLSELIIIKLVSWQKEKV